VISPNNTTNISINARKMNAIKMMVKNKQHKKRANVIIIGDSTNVIAPAKIIVI
jgi:hypothetical protein